MCSAQRINSVPVNVWCCIQSCQKKREKERKKKTNKLNFLNGTERYIFGWNCFYKFLNDLIFYFFPCSFLHISHLKPASKRPLFRSGYSECVLDGGVDRDLFFPCLLVIVFHSVCKFCWKLSVVFEMRMLSTTWCGCVWLDSMEEPVALFLI